MKVASSFFLLFLVFSMSCSTEPKSRLGDSCAKRSDCEVNLTCKEQKCVKDQNTGLSCKDIESDYKKRLDTKDNKSCQKDDDCTIISGLCGATDVTLDKLNILNKKANAKTLEDEWKSNGCKQDKSCSSHSNKVPGCINGTCKWKPDECQKNADCVALKGRDYFCKIVDKVKICAKE